MMIKDNTANVLQEADRRISKGLDIIDKDIEKLAKVIVVVKSGDLQRSITTVREDKKIIVGSPLKYAAKIEMDKPYLRPALEGVTATIRRVFKI